MGTVEEEETTAAPNVKDEIYTIKGINDEMIHLKVENNDSDANDETNDIIDEVTDDPPIMSVVLTTAPNTSPNCPMKQNLSSCEIFLCRIFRNKLAILFPACYNDK